MLIKHEKGKGKCLLMEKREEERWVFYRCLVRGSKCTIIHLNLLYHLFDPLLPRRFGIVVGGGKLVRPRGNGGKRFGKWIRQRLRLLM